VIVHQAVRENLRVVARHGLPDDPQQRMPILVVDKDLFPPVTARSYVVDGAGELDTQRASHDNYITQEEDGRQDWIDTGPEEAKGKT
jgi:hypothetical protein